MFMSLQKCHVSKPSCFWTFRLSSWGGTAREAKNVQSYIKKRSLFLKEVNQLQNIFPLRSGLASPLKARIRIWHERVCLKQLSEASFPWKSFKSMGFIDVSVAPEASFPWKSFKVLCVLMFMSLQKQAVHGNPSKVLRLLMFPSLQEQACHVNHSKVLCLLMFLSLQKCNVSKPMCFWTFSLSSWGGPHAKPKMSKVT